MRETIQELIENFETFREFLEVRNIDFRDVRYAEREVLHDPDFPDQQIDSGYRRFVIRTRKREIVAVGFRDEELETMSEETL